MPTVAAPPSVKFHLSLNVSSLDASVVFFQALLGREPAKCRPDYAKFEMDEPPVVLSLEPHFSPASGGALNHLGFRLGDSAELVEWQRRLELAGISTQREEGVECCYARQTKFWVRDPDDNLWEIYVLEEDIEHRGMGQRPEDLPQSAALPSSSKPAEAIWQHTLGTRLPEKIFALDNSTNQVLLRGSFNAPHERAVRQRLLGEARRVLTPGGSVLCHMLTGNRAASFDRGTLSGPASYVTHVPALDELLSDLTHAGFESPQLANHGEKPCFTQGGVEMRETIITARKPSE